MDDWERLDLAGQRITERIRTAAPGEMDELLQQKREINLLKRKMAKVAHGRFPGKDSALQSRI